MRSLSLVGPDTTLMIAPAGTNEAWRLPFELSIDRVGLSSLNRLPVNMEITWDRTHTHPPASSP